MGKDNVVQGNFSVEEATDLDNLYEKLKDMDLDTIVVIGSKGEHAFMAHTGFDSRMKMLGSIEALKMWLWNQGGE